MGFFLFKIVSSISTVLVLKRSNLKIQVIIFRLENYSRHLTSWFEDNNKILFSWWSSSSKALNTRRSTWCITLHAWVNSGGGGASKDHGLKQFLAIWELLRAPGKFKIPYFHLMIFGRNAFFEPQYKSRRLNYVIPLI